MATEPPAGERSATAERTVAGQNPALSQEEYLSLPSRIARSTKRRWQVVVGLFVVLTALGSFYVATLPDKYVSTGVISFQPRLDESNGRDLTALLAAEFPAVMASTSSVGQAATAAGVSTGQVSSGLVAAVEPSTLNLVFSVTLGTAQQAQNAAQSLYLSTVEYNATDPFLES